MWNYARLSRLLSEGGCCISCVLLRVLSKTELPNLQVRCSPNLYSTNYGNSRRTEKYQSTRGVYDEAGTLIYDRAISEGRHGFSI